MLLGVVVSPAPVHALNCDVIYDPTGNPPPSQLVIGSAGTYCFNAGTYDTQITINADDVTLTGSPGTVPSGVIIQPMDVTNNAISPSGSPQEGIIYANNVTGVTIEGMTVDGSVASSVFTGCGTPTLGKFIGVLLNGASGTVTDMNVTNLFQANPSYYGCQSDAGAGIYVETPASGTSTVTVSNNLVSNYQKGGIVCNWAGTTCTVNGNTVSPLPAATAANAPNGIQFGFGATGTVADNTVSGNVCMIPACLTSDMIASAGPSAGILLYQANGPITISGNTLTGNDAGIAMTYDTGDVTTTSNSIAGSTYVGALVYDESQTVSGNTFSGNPVDIEAVSDSPSFPTTVTVSDNVLSGSSPYLTEQAAGGTALILQEVTTTTTLIQTQVSSTTTTTTTSLPTTTTETQTLVSSTTTVLTTTAPTTTTQATTTTATQTQFLATTATALTLSTTTKTQTQTLSATVTQTQGLTTTFSPPTTFTTTLTRPVGALTIACDHATVVVGASIRCEATIAAAGSSPTGKVAWSSSTSGKFSPVSCKLSRHIAFSVCLVRFTPKVAGSHTVLTASYAGDSNNPSSAGSYNLVVTAKTTKTTVSCGQVALVAGSKTTITCKARMVGYSPTGIVAWAQSGTGMIAFSTKTCTISAGVCSITITPSGPGPVVLGASYLGDPNNQGSVGAIKLNIQ